MTTMIQKIGNGAPAAGQLKRGELGLDLNSNVIYSSSNGTDILVMGISEVSWEDINGLPEFILTIDPSNPDYIDITGLEQRVEINEGQISNNASDIIQNEADIKALQITVDGDPDDEDDDGLVGQVAVNVTEIASLWAALGDAVTGLVLGGKYNAEDNQVLDVTPDGTAAGLVNGQNLPIGEDTKGIYVIVTVGGTLEGTEVQTPDAGDHRSDGAVAFPGDWLLSDGQHGWILMDFHTDATEWGAIGGTITNQADLMAEFANYIKKTDTIDAGNYTAARK
jgi:hypothetical protein